MAACHESWTATLLADGRVLVAGGNSNPDAQAAAEVFDPGTGRWTATGSMAAAGASHTATLLPGGKVLVAGGYRGDWLATAELYDPSTGKWTATGSMATARGGHTATLMPDGNLLVVGGDASLGSGGGPMLASAELYDPGSRKWTATGSMTTARGALVATLLADGKLLVVGGRDAAVAIDGLATAELYDPRSGRWTATGNMAEGRTNGHAATLLADGRVLVVGDDHTRSAELYDPSTGQWTATVSTLVAPDGTATLLPDGRVLVVGRGCSGEELQGTASAEIYDPRGGL